MHVIRVQIEPMDVRDCPRFQRRLEGIEVHMTTAGLVVHQADGTSVHIPLDSSIKVAVFLYT
jgi:hypothetical protein